MAWWTRRWASVAVAAWLMGSSSCALVFTRDEPSISGDGTTLECSGHAPVVVDSALATFALIGLVFVTTAGDTDDDQARRVYGSYAGAATLLFSYSVYRGIQNHRRCRARAREYARK